MINKRKWQPFTHADNSLLLINANVINFLGERQTRLAISRAPGERVRE